MFAIYILSKSLKRSRSHQMRSNDVGVFSPIKERFLRCNQDCCLAIFWLATYILYHIRVAQMPRTTAASLMKSKAFQENFWSLVGFFLAKQAWGRQNKVEMQRGSKMASWHCDGSKLLSSEQASSLMQLLFIGYKRLYEVVEQLQLTVVIQ